jgi:hypothetical protein
MSQIKITKDVSIRYCNRPSLITYGSIQREEHFLNEKYIFRCSSLSDMNEEQLIGPSMSICCVFHRGTRSTCMTGVHCSYGSTQPAWPVFIVSMEAINLMTWGAEGGGKSVFCGGTQCTWLGSYENIQPAWPGTASV